MPTDVQTRVRYAETDKMGVVYHSNYIIYFELGRTEAMRRIGITYSELEKRGYGLAVIETGARYRSAARYDDLLTIRTWLREVRKTRLRFEYEILLEGKTVVTGFTVLAFLDLNSGMKPTRCPPDVEELALKGLEPDRIPN